MQHTYVGVKKFTYKLMFDDNFMKLVPNSYCLVVVVVGPEFPHAQQLGPFPIKYSSFGYIIGY